MEKGNSYKFAKSVKRVTEVMELEIYIFLVYLDEKVFIVPN